MENMNFFDWTTIAGLVTVIAFLWKLKEEVHKLGERVAKIEGKLEGAIFHPPGPPTAERQQRPQ